MQEPSNEINPRKNAVFGSETQKQSFIEADEITNAESTEKKKPVDSRGFENDTSQPKALKVPQRLENPEEQIPATIEAVNSENSGGLTDKDIVEHLNEGAPIDKLNSLLSKVLDQSGKKE